MQPLYQQRNIEDPNIISYMTLRKAIGWMAFLLPIVLVFGSFILDHTNQIRGSLSSYYWTHTRNVLVGALCVIGSFLMSYHGPQGFKSLDSIASKTAGLLAICVAFVPTSEHGDNCIVRPYTLPGICIVSCYTFLHVYFSFYKIRSIYNRTKEKQEPGF